MPKRICNPGTLLSPVPPALVTCGDMQEHNVLTVAWTGILNSNPPRTYISVRPERHSYELLKKTGEFVINLPKARMVHTVDSCGVYTGAKVNKFEKFNLTAEPSEKISTPRIQQCPVAIECRVFEVIPMGTHDVFMADIVSVAIDEELFDPTDKLHLEKAGLCAYMHGGYYTIGKKIGSYGYSAKKKRTKQVGKKGARHGKK